MWSSSWGCSAGLVRGACAARVSRRRLSPDSCWFEETVGTSTRSSNCYDEIPISHTRRSRTMTSSSSLHASPRAHHSRTISDEWQDGTIVDDFGDAEPSSSSSSVTTGFTAAKTPDELPDWDDWQTGAGTSAGGAGRASRSSSYSQKRRNKTPPSSSTPSSQRPHAQQPVLHNQADEDFFAALENSSSARATAPPSAFLGVAATPDGLTTFTPPLIMTPPVAGPSSSSSVAAASSSSISAPPRRPPSPPVIDLRSNRPDPADDDWFARFEKNPTLTRSDSSNSVDQSQLDSIHEARNSPMTLPSAQRNGGSDGDYFGNAAAKPSPSPSSARAPQQPSSSWWGSIRGLGSDLARHAVDYLDPGVDFTDEELKIARKMGAVDISSQVNTPLGSAGVTPVRGSTPVAGQGQTTKPRPAPSSPPRRSSTAVSASSVGSTVVSGAPGVDFRTLNPHWNTGSWSLSQNDPARLGDGASAALDAAARKPFRDPLAVNLMGRREETNPVISGFHSSHIQPYLPPRLKLGRTWKLLYSSDQDGVSLETLYRKVNIGLDPKRSGNGAANGSSPGAPSPSSASASTRHDAWLRGSSSAARAALGSDFTGGGTNSSSSASRRLGSGLTSVSDAGLVLAIRDADDQVFGAYVNEGFKNTKGYYGNGDCFLWRSVQPDASTPYVRTYPATLLNNYHIQSTSSYLSLGGGINGKYGLWIDSSFEKGVSARCETFDNDVLCDSREKTTNSNNATNGHSSAKETHFEPVIVEIWAVGID